MNLESTGSKFKITLEKLQQIKKKKKNNDRQRIPNEYLKTSERARISWGASDSPSIAHCKHGSVNICSGSGFSNTIRYSTWVSDTYNSGSSRSVTTVYVIWKCCVFVILIVLSYSTKVKPQDRFVQMFFFSFNAPTVPTHESKYQCRLIKQTVLTPRSNFFNIPNKIQL